MFYTVYKITNIVNGKHYIGKHQTKDLDDGYFGSGKLIRRAIKKYGKDAFIKQILRVCSTEKEMDLVEKILVVPDPEISYNLCNGGQGGWSYVNRNGLNKTFTLENAIKAGRNGAIAKHKKYKMVAPKAWLEAGKKSMLGKKHTDATKKKISKGAIKRIGNNNGSFGTCWITNGQVNKKIKKDELDIWLEKGYYKGRI